MPGILGIISSKQLGREQETKLAAMAYPLVFFPEQEVEWFRHEWYSAGTVGYGKSFLFLKKSSAYKEGVLLIMDGEVFPDAADVPHELATSAPTIQRAEYCLHLYLQYGPQFVGRLNGNFVIAIFDNRNRMVHLYNDRFGSEPLYIWTGEDELAFATSQRSLLKYREDIGLKYDRDALAELIVFEKVLGNKTLFQDISRMVSASHAIWDGKQLRVEKYWRLNIGGKAEELNNWKDAGIELNERLEKSITKRLADSAKATALISGGIDSRLLLSHCPTSTIAVTFSNRNSPPSIERHLAGKIAKILGHEFILIDREIDHYATVAELAVDVNEGQMTFMGYHSLGLHQQMLDFGIQVVLTAHWWDTLFKSKYSVGHINEYVYPDEPDVLKSRRVAWYLSNSGVIRKLRHQNLAMLALSNEMKNRAAVVKERVITEFSLLLSEDVECWNLAEYYTLSDFQSRAGIGFQRGLRMCFLDRSPAYDNDLLTFGASIPVDWKRDGRIVRWALKIANPKLAWINDANTGLPAGLCPPWNRVLGSARKAVRDIARGLSRYSKIIASYRQPYTIFSQHSSWHNINEMLRSCKRYRSMVESTVEQLDERIFDKNMIVELLHDDLSVAMPRFHKLFEIVLTFGLFDKKWGPSANRNAVSGEIANMKIVDLRDV